MKVLKKVCLQDILQVPILYVCGSICCTGSHSQKQEGHNTHKGREKHPRSYKGEPVFAGVEVIIHHTHSLSQHLLPERAAWPVEIKNE